MIVVLFCQLPAACQSTTEAQPDIHYIEGLIEVKKDPKRWVYKCKNTTQTVTLYEKIKDVPDLRPYEIAHPKKHKAKQKAKKFRDACEFIGPVISVVGWVVVTVMEALTKK